MQKEEKMIGHMVSGSEFKELRSAHFILISKKAEHTKKSTTNCRETHSGGGGGGEHISVSFSSRVPPGPQRKTLSCFQQGEGKRTILKYSRAFWFSFFKKNFILHWSIVDEHCCVSYRCTAK